MGAKVLKRYSSCKSQPKVFKVFLNFLPNGPHKTKFGSFDILKIEILMYFVIFSNIGPYRGGNFKTLLLPKTQRPVMKLVLNFSPDGPHKMLRGFLKF